MRGGPARAFEIMARPAGGTLVGTSVAIIALASISHLGCGGDAFSVASAPEGGAAEASVPVLDGAPADGSRGDGGLVDAGAGWCASHGTGHTFCEDFLTGVPDQLVEYAVNGAIAANTSDYESPPQSMAASVPMLAKGASAIAFASHDLSKATGTQFAVSAYFRGASCFPANGPQSGNTASVLAFNFTDSNYQIVVAVSPTSVELIEITADADGGNQKLQPQSVQSTASSTPGKTGRSRSTAARS